ncbi:MAG: amidohydrolase family protein [Actinobacteria bacterium]|nr:amidohydrolase family protein [Actinomycetota bacterium]
MRTLFTGGLIRTSVSATTADWLLIEDQRVVAAGGAHDSPAADTTVELGGGTLLPAFRDAHVHLPATGLYATGLDLRGERSAEVILAAFRRKASEDPSAILFGGNFEDPLSRTVLAPDLDEAVGSRPALLARADMHSCIVSTVLLAALPLDGVEGVDRDSDGAPTGYLREQAAAEAWTWFDKQLTPLQQTEAVRAAVALAYSKGIAEVHEMFVVEWRGWPAAEVFTEAIRDVALEVALWLGTDEVERVVELGHRRIGGDYFLDGSFGSHTAWLGAPYTSSPPAGSGPTGISYRDDEALFELFRAAQLADLQMGVHAIGDAAIEQAVRTWERVAGEVGTDEVKRKGHRIEHFECASDEHIRRAVALGLSASVQPAFDLYWGGEAGLYSDRIGWERAQGMNRFGSMLSAGLNLAAGSDSTVTPLDPFLQMFALRQHHVAAERLDAATALDMHTRAPAAISDSGAPRGTLEVGHQADLVLVSRDPLTTPDDQLQATEVLGTWIAGQRVWPPDDAEAA